MAHKKILLAGLLSCMVLGGCEILGIDKKNKPPLEGDRLSISAGESHLKVDPELEKVYLTLPPQHLFEDWEQPGRISSHLVGHVALASSLKPLWTASLGDGTTDEARILSTPIVAENLLYGLDSSGVVQALNCQTGAPIWRTLVIPQEKEGYPVLGGGVSFENKRLFVATAYSELLVLNPQDGTILWRKSLGSPSRNAPAIHNGRVYVMTVNNQLEVFDARSGEILWVHSGVMESVGLLGTSTPAIEGDTVIVAYSSGEVFALRAQNGHVLWSETVAAPKRADSAATLAHIRARPVLDKNTAYLINHNGQMAALNLHNGQRLWERDIGGVHTPAIVGEYIFQITSHSELICLDKHHGRLYWVKALPKIPDFTGTGGWAGPLVAGGLIYITGVNGQLLVFDPLQKGELKATYTLPAGASLSPVAAGKTLYILTDSGDVAAFR